LKRISQFGSFQHYRFTAFITVAHLFILRIWYTIPIRESDRVWN